MHLGCMRWYHARGAQRPIEPNPRILLPAGTATAGRQPGRPALETRGSAAEHVCSRTRLHPSIHRFHLNNQQRARSRWPESSPHTREARRPEATGEEIAYRTCKQSASKGKTDWSKKLKQVKLQIISHYDFYRYIWFAIHLGIIYMQIHNKIYKFRKVKWLIIWNWGEYWCLVFMIIQNHRSVATKSA